MLNLDETNSFGAYPQTTDTVFGEPSWILNSWRLWKDNPGADISF